MSEGLAGMPALQTAHCDPWAGWSHPEREEVETGSRVGRGGEGWLGRRSEQDCVMESCG